MDPHTSEPEVADVPKKPPDDPMSRPKRMTAAAEGGRDLYKEYIKKMYDEVAGEPLPDELQKLLEELDKPQTGSRHGKGSNDA